MAAFLREVILDGVIIKDFTTEEESMTYFLIEEKDSVAARFNSS